MKNIINCIFVFMVSVSLFWFSVAFANYSTHPLIQPITIQTQQDAYAFINKKTANKRLLSARRQGQKLRKFLDHLFSPWWQHDSTLTRLKKIEQNYIHHYQIYRGWGENYHRNTKIWIKKIVHNMSIAKFPDMHACNAIAVDNALVRLLPTLDPVFESFRKPGGGYPFDLLQETIVWAGRPLKVVHLSVDKAWAFVLTPTVSGWVQTKKIAYVDSRFIRRWKYAKHYVAPTIEEASIVDTQGFFRLKAHMGAVFPLAKTTENGYRILIPVADTNRQAVIKEAIVSKRQAALMPLATTPNNFAQLMNQLLGMPYAWGGNYFYNDCSGILQSLYTPFGLWLPRNSVAQKKAGYQVSLDRSSAESRRDYILKNGVPFLTLIYVPGHIMLYVGEEDGEVMSFQDVWALITGDDEGRAIIGKTVLMPLKIYYKNDMQSQITTPGLTLSFIE